jgi:hypothetical protein
MKNKQTKKKKLQKKPKQSKKKTKQKQNKQKQNQNLKLIIYWHTFFLFNFLDITTVRILHVNLTFI